MRVDAGAHLGPVDSLGPSGSRASTRSMLDRLTAGTQDAAKNADGQASTARSTRIRMSHAMLQAAQSGLEAVRTSAGHLDGAAAIVAGVEHVVASAGELPGDEVEFRYQSLTASLDDLASTAKNEGAFIGGSRTVEVRLGEKSRVVDFRDMDISASGLGLTVDLPSQEAVSAARETVSTYQARVTSVVDGSEEAATVFATGLDQTIEMDPAGVIDLADELGSWMADMPGTAMDTQAHVTVVRALSLLLA